MKRHPIHRARLAGIVLGSVAVLGIAGSASAQNSNFSHVPNAAISGHNNKSLSSVSVRDCMNACISERGFECKSFDYNKTAMACDLSDKTADDVGGLKRDYAGDPYDHYEKSDVIEISATVGSGNAESKPAKNVIPALVKMSGPESTLIETDLDGFSSKYGDAVQQGDHVQGFTMTASGRLVISYSRQGSSSQPCKGMLAYSSPFNPDNPNQDLSWNYYCSATDGPEGHPSAIQATGEVVAVGTHGGTRFYHIKPGSNGVQPLRHLYMAGGRDSTGVVYNHKDDRYYALNASGGVTTGTASTTLCRTGAGESLFDTSTKFDDCKTLSAYTSGQGSNLIMGVDGTMYLVSAFSSADESVEGSWGAYGFVCESTTAAAAIAGYGLADEFEDKLVVSTISWNSGSANLVQNLNLERTQRAQTCVHKRPSFRFAGGVATTDKGELIGLWAGRQNPPLLPLTDEFEFSFQNLSTAAVPVKTYAHNVSVDCAVDDITDEGTSNTITATFMDKNRNVLGSATMKDISAFNCATEWIDFEAELRSKAEFVKLSTDGSDGFMVDVIQLYIDGTKLKSYGVNNDKGWCFSTDRSDGQGSWNYAADGICVPHHTWSFSGARVTGNPFDTIQKQEGSQRKYTYSLDIDCDVTGIDNEGTENRITAIFMDANKKEIGRGSHKGDTERGILGCYDIEFDVVTNGKASWYRLETDGSDGAMLDQIYVYEGGNEVDVEGASNDVGWCLSTDPNDAQGDWKDHAAQNTCRKAWDFKL